MLFLKNWVLEELWNYNFNIQKCILPNLMMFLRFKSANPKNVLLVVTKSNKNTNKNTFLGDVLCLSSGTIKVATDNLFLQL